MAVLGWNGGFLVDWSACGMVVDVFWAVECVARVFEGREIMFYSIFGCFELKMS